MGKDTRQLLLDAATQALSKNPGASMNDIAEAAGVGRATLYRYFPSRDELIRSLTLESYQQVNAALEPVLARNLRGGDLLLEILEVIIPMGDRYHFLLSERSFVDDPEIQALEVQSAHDWSKLFEHFKDEGLIAPEVPIAWAVATLESLIYTAWISVHEGYIARRDAAQLVYRTFLTGLGTSSANT